MSYSSEFREPTHFATGAIGPSGQRVFYLQAGEPGEILTLKLEKQQVQALGQFLSTVLDDLPSAPEALPPADLIEPVQPAWIIGQIAVGVDEDESRVVLMLEELVLEDDDEDIDEDDLFDDVPTGSTLRVHVTPAQARAFIAQAESLMSKSRPPCPLCGKPEDPGGHACPRLN